MGTSFGIRTLIIGSLQSVLLDRKLTLRTLCTYDQYIRTLFMERRPEM